MISREFHTGDDERQIANRAKSHNTSKYRESYFSELTSVFATVHSMQ